MNADQLVMEYLAALRVAVSGLPRADELVADIGSRIADVRMSRPDDSPAEVQAFLDSLGNPYEIAATAFRPQASAPRPPVPARTPIPPPAALPMLPPARGTSQVSETLAVVALTAGAVLLPVIGPVTGMVMASCSPRWRPADKTRAWLLTASPLLMLGLILPAAVVGAPYDIAGGLAVLAFVAAVLGPMAAGLLLGCRLASGPRHALRDEAYQHPHAHRPHPRRWHAGPPYPPRLRHAPRYPPRFQPVQRLEPYPVRSSGRSFPKR